MRNGPLPVPYPLFPADNWWNVDVSAAPLDPNGANFIAFMGAGIGLHPDFGGDVDPDDPNNPEVYGFPYASVDSTQSLVPLFWTAFGDQSDEGYPGRPLGYPIPEEAKSQARWIEGGNPGNVDPGGDRHLLIVDREKRILYELYRTFWNTGLNRWEAQSGAIYSLDGNDRRPETWTSADAAGLAIFPGLVRRDEACGAEPIRHAFRFTSHPVNGYVYPASHDASTSANANAPPLGLRMRLRPDFDLAGYDPCVQRIFQAMKTYGIILADNGSEGYIQGTYDPLWDNDILNPAFGDIELGDFQVIQLGWQPAAPASTGPHDFFTVTPCRLLDTRNPFGPFGGPPLPPLWTDDQRPGVNDPSYFSPAMRIVRAGGQCGVPAGARAIATNVTVVTASGPGYVRVFRGNGGAQPTSVVSFNTGQTRASQVVIPLSSGTPNSATFGLSASTANGQPVHFVVDVTGYFQ